MEQELGILYNQLAQKIDSMIPVEWDKLYYLGEVAKGKIAWGSVFYFTMAGEKQFYLSHDMPRIFGVSQDIYRSLLRELNDLLLNLYDCFLNNVQELWEQVSLSLHSDGKFNIDYKYDVLDNAKEGPLGRQVIWAYNAFGYMPNDGFSKKILEEYLNTL